MKFWTDNWLGHRIADKLGIPQHILALLNCLVGDYYVEGVRYFTSYFITRHLNVVIDILQAPIHDFDHRIWLDSTTGVLTSRQKL